MARREVSESMVPAARDSEVADRVVSPADGVPGIARVPQGATNDRVKSEVVSVRNNGTVIRNF